MPLQIFFWILMLFWLILGAAPLLPKVNAERSWASIGGVLLPFLAVAVLGWATFGQAIHG